MDSPHIGMHSQEVLFILFVVADEFRNMAQTQAAHDALTVHLYCAC